MPSYMGGFRTLCDAGLIVFFRLKCGFFGSSGFVSAFGYARLLQAHPPIRLTAAFVLGVLGRTLLLLPFLLRPRTLPQKSVNDHMP